MKTHDQMMREFFKGYDKVSASAKRSMAASLVFGMLYGCGTQPPQPNPVPVVPEKTTVNVDPALVTYCEQQPHIPVQKYSQKQSLQAAEYWQNLYTVCAGKQRKLVDLTAKAFNLPTPQPPKPAAALILQ